jgi:putative ABC transport system ATP-binding protein
MIELNNISKVYRTKTIETVALNKINLKIDKGEFLSIMGPSGCGKSTLLNIMGLLDEPSEGEININQNAIQDYKSKALAHFRNDKLGFIFQSFHLINDLSVVDNVELPLLYRKSTASQRKKLAEEALESVGLKNRMRHFPSQLSGGQKQRVAIARAIVGKPDIILADEPTGNLDPQTAQEIFELFLTRAREDNSAIIMATHNLELAKQMDKLYKLQDGSLVKI